MMSTSQIPIVAVPLEVDPEETTECDPTLVLSSKSSQTEAAVSSADAHRYENGRRYHGYRDGLYLLPNDNEEQNRLDLQHHLFRLGLDGDLVRCPVTKNTRTVLDVGCGTGKWAIDFANENPDVEVLGIDLSAIQPNEVPKNCTFLVGDVESKWTHEQKFDLIHSRAMIGAFKNWPQYFKQAYDNLNPGGYLELQEYCLPGYCDDPEAAKTSKIVKWLEHVVEGGSKVDLRMTIPLQFEQMLREAGFEEINAYWVHWPIGPWAKGDKNKLIGKWLLANLHDGIATTSAMFTRVLGWSNEDFQTFQAEVREEMKAQKTHVYKKLVFCYARKPETSARVPQA